MKNSKFAITLVLLTNFIIYRLCIAGQCIRIFFVIA